MLYVNSVQVNTRDLNDDFVKDYHKTIKDITEYYGDYLVVETKRRPRTDKNTGQPRFPGARGLLLVSTVNRKLGDNISVRTRRSVEIMGQSLNKYVIYLDAVNKITQNLSNAAFC